MYFVIKLLIDNTTVKENIFYDFQDVYTKEVKRAAAFAKRNHRELDFRNVSEMIHRYTKYEILKEAKKFNQLKKVHDDYKLNPIWRIKSYILYKDTIKLLFGNSYKISFIILKLRIRDYQKEQIISSKLHSVKLKKSGKYWYIYLTASKEEICKRKGDVVMGVDLGVRVPAVCVTSTKKIKFVGNGRYIRYIERTMKAKYRRLDKAKNKMKIKKMNHKLARIKHHLDHQISKEIIDFAVKNNVAFIKLEKLTGLQQAMVKRKMKKEYIWSYYQMQQYIEHKAYHNGIQIRYVDPYNTSKKCPLCDKLNNPEGRLYSCVCGYRAHRDLVGAFNIMRSTRIYTGRP